MRALLALVVALSLAAPALGQVAGSAYVEVSGPLCASIRAELSAIGVPAAESPALAIWSVECGDEVRLIGPSGSVERSYSGVDDSLALEVAEYVRAQLLVARVASGLSNPPSNLTPNGPTREGLAPNAQRPGPQDAQRSDAQRSDAQSIHSQVSTEPTVPGIVERPDGASQDRARSTLHPEDSRPRVSMSVFVGGLFSGGASLPALTLTAEPRLYFGDLSVAAHVGASVASPAIDPLANTEFDEAMLGVSVRSQFLDLGLDLMYTRQVVSTPLHIGVGVGLSALRLRLTGHGAQELGLRDQSSAAWTAFPYLRGGVLLRAHSRIQIRLEGRLGWLAREMVATIPVPVEPITIVASGVAGELALGIEVSIR